MPDYFEYGAKSPETQFVAGGDNNGTKAPDETDFSGYEDDDELATTDSYNPLFVRYTPGFDRNYFSTFSPRSHGESNPLCPENEIPMSELLSTKLA